MLLNLSSRSKNFLSHSTSDSELLCTQFWYILLLLSFLIQLFKYSVWYIFQLVIYFKFWLLISQYLFSHCDVEEASITVFANVCLSVMSLLFSLWLLCIYCSCFYQDYIFVIAVIISFVIAVVVIVFFLKYYCYSVWLGSIRDWCLGCITGAWGDTRVTGEYPCD